MTKRRKTEIDLGPMESVACATGQADGGALMAAADIVGQMLRYKFMVEEQRLERERDSRVH